MPSPPTAKDCVETKHRNLDALYAWEVFAADEAARVQRMPSREWFKAVEGLRAERATALDALVAAAQACTSAAARGQRVRKLLVLGDRVSSAQGMRPSQGWVALLEARIAGANLPWSVVNESEMGRLTVEGLKLLPDLLRKHQPAVVAIELGINDAVHGRDVEAAEANLAEMIAAVRATGATPLLVGGVLRARAATANAAYLAMYASLAAREKVAVVPNLVDGATGLQPDNVHPDAGSQPKMLENAWPVLQPLLAKK